MEPKPLAGHRQVFLHVGQMLLHNIGKFFTRPEFLISKLRMMVNVICKGKDLFPVLFNMLYDLSFGMIHKLLLSRSLPRIRVFSIV